MSNVIVSGVLEIHFTVSLPVEKQFEGNMCDDPAKEAVLSFIPQSGNVYIYGDDEVPVGVWIEKHEEDIVIEEDERE